MSRNLANRSPVPARYFVAPNRLSTNSWEAACAAQLFRLRGRLLHVPEVSDLAGLLPGLQRTHVPLGDLQQIVHPLLVLRQRLFQTQSRSLPPPTLSTASPYFAGSNALPCFRL